MRTGLLLKVTSTSPSATHNCQQARTISTPATPSSGLRCRRVHLDRVDGRAALAEAARAGSWLVVRGVDAVVMGPHRGWRTGELTVQRVDDLIAVSDELGAAAPGGVPGTGH